MVMARGDGFGGLVPCIGETPIGEIQCPCVDWQTLPRPLVAPEVRLKTRNLPETRCDHQPPPGCGRRLRETIGVEVTWPPQMCGRLAEAGDGAPGGADRPDVCSGHLLIPGGQHAAIGVGRREL